MVDESLDLEDLKTKVDDFREESAVFKRPPLKREDTDNYSDYFGIPKGANFKVSLPLSKL